MYNVIEGLNTTYHKSSLVFKDYVQPQFLTLNADLKKACYGNRKCADRTQWVTNLGEAGYC